MSGFPGSNRSGGYVPPHQRNQQRNDDVPYNSGSNNRFQRDNDYDNRDNRGYDNRGKGGGKGKGGNRDWGNNSYRDDGFPMDRMGDLGRGLREIDWEQDGIVEIQKNFYEEHLEVQARSDSENKAIMAKFDIKIVSGENMKCVSTFEEANMPDHLLKAVYAQGF